MYAQDTGTLAVTAESSSHNYIGALQHLISCDNVVVGQLNILLQRLHDPSSNHLATAAVTRQRIRNIINVAGYVSDVATPHIRRRQPAYFNGTHTLHICAVLTPCVVENSATLLFARRHHCTRSLAELRALRVFSCCFITPLKSTSEFEAYFMLFYFDVELQVYSSFFCIELATAAANAITVVC